MSKAALEKVFANPRLPSLPMVAMQVLELTRDEHVDLQKVADAVRNDQALATKILRTVNSSFYGLTKPCATIRQAIVYLGMNTIKTLVLGFSLVDSIKVEDDEVGFNFVKYWQRALYSAVGARDLANRTRCCDPEEAFLAALMQDIGMVLLYRAFGDQYLQCIDLAGMDHRQLPRLEKENFELTHQVVGYELGKRWKLPPQIQESINHHHGSDKAIETYRKIVHCVELGGLAASAMTMSDPGSVMQKFIREASAWFNIPSESAGSILSSIRNGVRDLAPLFRIQAGAAPDIELILAQAETQLVEHQFRMEQEREQLLESNQDLVNQTITDPLTGANNRKFFDQELARLFETARKNNGCLAVVFSDADRFKSVNDTHGHQAGDSVLAELSQRMRETVGERGHVCRYGGEEFAILLPNMDRIEATRVAEEVRLAVESRPVDLSGISGCVPELPVTVSLGVAAYEPSVSAMINRAELLLRVADQAVYAAKQGGRNCVRVFRPRTSAGAEQNRAGTMHATA